MQRVLVFKHNGNYNGNDGRDCFNDNNYYKGTMTTANGNGPVTITSDNDQRQWTKWHIAQFQWPNDNGPMTMVMNYDEDATVRVTKNDNGNFNFKIPSLEPKKIGLRRISKNEN